MIQPAIREDIVQRLKEIEQEEDVVVLYACESGSRAWGFASTDSDYDVRFLYIRRRDWYLSIDMERKRDVIERPIDDELDISGWDIRKALRLFRTSNPPLLEWLDSPIVYAADGRTREAMKEMIPAVFSARSCFHHYLSMARRTFREHGSGDEIKQKKYFYILRPLFACLWIEAGRGAVPIEFARLVEATVESSELRADIDMLLERKRSGVEMGLSPVVPSLHEFIASGLERLPGIAAALPHNEPDAEQLNRFFRATLDSSWQ